MAGRSAAARPLLRELVEIAALAVALYVLAAVSIQAVHVVGTSMQPSLQNNDLVLASRLDYRFHSPARGDVVIVKDPYDSSQNFIKRVIGLPGDRVLIRAGRLYLNGSRVEEPYIAADWRTTANWPADPDRPDGEQVPPGSYFLLGDNRDHSSDSRLFGYASAGQIEGKAIARLWPLTGIELLDSRPTLAAG